MQICGENKDEGAVPRDRRERGKPYHHLVRRRMAEDVLKRIGDEKGVTPDGKNAEKRKMAADSETLLGWVLRLGNSSIRRKRRSELPTWRNKK